MMTQTWAIFVESYRHLNSKKLFWITLVISGVIVLTFAAIGMNEKGLTFLWWELPFPIAPMLIGSPEVFYKLMFLNLGVAFWLTWGATILALVSTAGIMPEFISGGAIDVTLSKPMSRLRLFLTKYAAAMLFVGLQVGVFSVASFLVIGLRGRSWEPAIFLTIPIVVLFFSYLYCVCTLLGIVTRSTVAALLLTMLVWLGVFAVNSTDAILLVVRTQNEQSVEWLRNDIAEREKALAEATSETPQDGIVNAVKGAFSVDRKERELATRREQLEGREGTLRLVARWHDGFVLAKTALPKTAETIGLLERAMVSLADMQRIGDQDENAVQFEIEGDSELPIPQDPRAVQNEVIAKSRERPIWWIVGTSLGFEAVVLGLAGWIFCRRDF